MIFVQHRYKGLWGFIHSCCENSQRCYYGLLIRHNDPSVLQNGSFLKIGRFDSKGELLYQDTLESSLIQIADKAIDLIYLKYLKTKITYEHDRRVETYPYARDAIREAIYNALVHNVYMFGVPIQIRIENESIIISNQCVLPEGWTAQTLLEAHESKPYNPDIANVFYRAGYIENWGRGIEKICNSCKGLGADMLRYEIIGNGVRLHFSALKSVLLESDSLTGLDGSNDVGVNVGVNEKNLLELIVKDSNVSAQKASRILGVSKRQTERLFASLKGKGLIERAGSDKAGRWFVAGKGGGRE